MRICLLVLAASLCSLSAIKADSMFNFDNDPTYSFPNGSIVSVNNGIAASFNGGSIVPATSLACDICGNGNGDYYPYLTLSGNVLVTYDQGPFPSSSPKPSLGVAFNSELNSIEFNFSFSGFHGGEQNFNSYAPISVQAYNNGTFVGSETTLPVYNLQEALEDEGCFGRPTSLQTSLFKARPVSGFLRRPDLSPLL